MPSPTPADREKKPMKLEEFIEDALDWHSPKHWWFIWILNLIGILILYILVKFL